MHMALEKRQRSFTMLVGLLLLLLLTACGNTASSSTASPSTTTSTHPTATHAVGAPATAGEKALLPLMTLVGQTTAKLVAGHHTFEADGKLKNGDTKQHDIYLQATLLDASGAIIGSSAFFTVDNVPGGATANFAIPGTTMQPTWTSVQVKVVGLSENLGSSGGD
jgi:ABC-type phosphate transport system substrate-binding protein